MTYQEQIRHPKWQKKRLEVLKANKFRCQNCGNKEEELHVHHPLYRKGAMIWEYKVEELESLCHKCHKEKHAALEKIGKALAACKSLPLVLAYIQGLNDAISPVVKPAELKKAIRKPAVIIEEEPEDPPENNPLISEEEAEKTAANFFEKMKALML